jgi:hypothetical protein
MKKVVKFIRFKKEKTIDGELFRQRYVPIFDYLVKRVADSLSLPISSCKAQLFYQDGDNFMKKLVTLRLTIMLVEDDDKRTEP